MKFLKDLIRNVSLLLYGIIVLVIEILLGILLLSWIPIVWISQWIMDNIQKAKCDTTVFEDIGKWYIDKVFVSFIDTAMNTMDLIFLNKKANEHYFRKLVYERLGL